jgi:hypothetical protein
MRWAKKTAAKNSKPFVSGLETESIAAIEIRDLCLAARVDAECVANVEGNEEAEPALSRYRLSRDRSIETANKLSDSFYRDLALHYIYDLCRRANDETAQRIFEQIETAKIRDDIIHGRTALFD